MHTAFHHLVLQQANQTPASQALVFKDEALSYGQVWSQSTCVATGLRQLGLERYDRVAVYLEKTFETVLSFVAASVAQGVFVPINPVLRQHQVAHILSDCDVRVLVTSAERLKGLAESLEACPKLEWIVLVGPGETSVVRPNLQIVSWSELAQTPAEPMISAPQTDNDMAAILYTSGSTGRPKGVVLSHRNLIVGAASVSQYLENTAEDRILSVLPLSFDAGLSQLTTAFHSGACCVLLNYLLPREVPRQCERQKITGLTGVPPLWFQLAELDWPATASHRIRYFANTGGHMPRSTLQQLRQIFPKARPFLMYGLTEAFRSTYLDPAEIDRRPDSIGKAIPNAEILVVRPDGAPCDPGEEGELVHRGALVAKGYWNDPEMTRERFRPAPNQPAGIPTEELAVWSGDIVRRDDEGFLYFVGRRDDMIKTSGYRVCPTEIEEVIFATGLVDEVAALGLPDPRLGQRIAVVIKPQKAQPLDEEAILAACRKHLPAYMIPAVVAGSDGLYRNPNGKIDRRRHAEELAEQTADACS